MMTLLTKCTPLLAILAFSVFLPSQASAQRTRLEASMAGTGLTDGTAKYEIRNDRRKFSVELEDTVPNQLLLICVIRQGSIQKIGMVRTNAAGFADFNLDSRLGQGVFRMMPGDVVQVTASHGMLIARGTLRQRK